MESKFSSSLRKGSAEAKVEVDWRRRKHAQEHASELSWSMCCTLKIFINLCERPISFIFTVTFYWVNVKLVAKVRQNDIDLRSEICPGLE